MQRARHCQRFPLGRDPDLTLLAPTKREPIPVVVKLSLNEVREFDRHISNDWVLQEITVVDDFDSDDS